MDLGLSFEGNCAFGDALEIIFQRFEDGSIDDRLAYHNREHTRGVVWRAEMIALLLGLSDRERLLVKIAAAFHDTVQRWLPARRDDGAIIRQRKTGVNERASARVAVQWMKRWGCGRCDISAHSHLECDLVTSAILATVPSMSSGYNRTVVQAALTPDCHPVVRTVALADLGAAGAEPEIFRNEGRNLFIEQELDIIEAIRQGDISVKNQQWYLTRYRAWIKSQIDFACGRKTLFETELGNLSDDDRDGLRLFFAHFDRSIKIAEENAEEAERFSFEQMARRLVPNAF